MERLLAVMLLALGLLMATVPAAAATPVSTDTARTSHVIVISIDGLRPDAIATFDLATLQRLLETGSYTLNAQTILPSKTLPSHTSMITGRTPDVHGITFNRALAEEDVVHVPTMFELAHDAGLTTAAFYSKAKFRHLDRPGSYDYRQAPAFNSDNWMATRTVPAAIQYLRHRRPNLLFVHIGETDYAGHGAGWMGFFYGLAARRADAGVASIIEAADETYGSGKYTLIVTADHGGHGRNHGTDALEDTTIPWIVYGQGVATEGRPEGVRTMDTAATALWLLGVPVPAEFEGAPVLAAFTATADSAAVVSDP